MRTNLGAELSLLTCKISRGRNGLVRGSKVEKPWKCETAVLSEKSPIAAPLQKHNISALLET